MVAIACYHHVELINKHIATWYFDKLFAETNKNKAIIQQELLNQLKLTGVCEERTGIMRRILMSFFQI